MHTIYEIAQHVVLDQPYHKEESKPLQIGSQESRIYKILSESTKFEIIEKVRNFVQGTLSEELIENEINKDNAYLYLAAAKVIDLDTSPSEMVKSTYRIRELAVLNSKPEKDGRGKINMLNAFSMPPLDKEDIDLLLSNELDISHPIVKKAAFGEERNNHLKRIYTYGQKDAKVISEMVPVIEAVVKDRFQSMLKAADSLPIDTTVVYKGCSGAGKSFAIKKLTEQCLRGISAENAIQSTDNIKKEILTRTKNVFNDQQVFLLGFSTFKMLSEAMKEKYPKLSTVQEGWFNSTFTLEGLFKDLKVANLKLEMHDFDGDYEALCLRVLARYPGQNSQKTPLDDVERAFKTSRESREQLLKSLRENVDSYQFKFVQANGEVRDDIDPKSIVSDSAGVDKEIAATKKVRITEQHAKTFGESLNSFIGMTIEEAFEKAKAV